jgi:cardiolipin-specific phospholipase
MTRSTSLADEIGSSYSEHPFTIKDSLKVYGSSWLNSGTCAEYEKKLLNHIPFIKNQDQSQNDNIKMNASDLTRKIEIINTSVNDNDIESFIHEVCITNTQKNDKEDENEPPIDIIVIHGYAAALGFFYTNIDGLSTIPNSRLHLIDLLGFGCSGRPNFPIEKDNDRSLMRKVMNVESFFIDSFENWRIKRGINKCVVVAHSLGGYLMSCYYLKYGRDIITKLILVSPVGVEDNDMSLYKRYEECPEEYDDNNEDIDEYLGFDYNDEGLTDSNESVNIDRDYNIAKRQGVDLSKEFTDHIHDDCMDFETINESDTESLISIISNNEECDDHEHNHHHHECSHQTRVEQLMKQIKTRVVPGKFLTRLWEMNYTPIDIVRWFGPFAGKVVAIWVYNRFSRVHDSEQLWDVCNYATRLFLQRGSGEYCLGTILAPGSLARLPLSVRFPKQVKIPVLLLYGELDWMDKQAGYGLCQKINAAGGRAKFRIIPDAGHHLYVDNRAEFERQVKSFIGV